MIIVIYYTVRNTDNVKLWSVYLDPWLYGVQLNVQHVSPEAWHYLVSKQLLNCVILRLSLSLNFLTN